MERPTYSSTAAFLAHFRALSNAALNPAARDQLTEREREILNVMNRLMEGLGQDERSLLLADAASVDTQSGAARRRRERVQLKLRRLLVSNGIVSA
jgi:hypothetical protein